LKAVKLRFRSPVRLGGLKGFESYDNLIHSDTLFGAIANAIAYLNLDINEFIEKVGSGEITISSAFPYCRDDSYFPPPLVRPKVDGDEKTILKNYSKSFLRKDLFECVLKGEPIPENSPMVKLERFAEHTDIASVTLDRTTANSGLYTYAVLTFKSDCGLYTIIKSSNGDFKDFIEPAFRLLADEGIGGNRTSGFGHFDYEVFDFNLNVPQSEYSVTLSLAITAKDNLVSYDLLKRGGYIFSRTSTKDAIKPVFFMLREGSVVLRDSGFLIDLDDYGNYSDYLGHKVFVYARVFPAEISDIYFEGWSR
jgi:CRISPR-associated protein Csm4